MNFEIEHVFDASVEAVETAMFSPDYTSFLLTTSDLLAKAALAAFEDDGLHIRRRVHVVPRPGFDRIGAARVPPEWFEYTEEAVWDRQHRKLSFVNIPALEPIANRVDNRGEITLEALTPERTRRRAQGVVKLHNMPLLAKPLVPLVERMLAQEATRMLNAEAQVLRQWLASQRPQHAVQA